MDHVLGKIEMTPTQVKAALSVLRKTLPDLCIWIENNGVFRRHKKGQLLSHLSLDTPPCLGGALTTHKVVGLLPEERSHHDSTRVCRAEDKHIIRSHPVGKRCKSRKTAGKGYAVRYADSHRVKIGSRQNV